jgi:hypothetical protein
MATHRFVRDHDGTFCESFEIDAAAAIVASCGTM